MVAGSFPHPESSEMLQLHSTVNHRRSPINVSLGSIAVGKGKVHIDSQGYKMVGMSTKGIHFSLFGTLLDSPILGSSQFTVDYIPGCTIVRYTD